MPRTPLGYRRGAATEPAAGVQLERGLGLVSEPYRTGRAGKLLKASRALTTTAAGLSLLAHRNRAAGALADAAHLAAGLCTRFGVYNAGVESTKDPKYVVVPQRGRLACKIH